MAYNPDRQVGPWTLLISQPSSRPVTDSVSQNEVNDASVTVFVTPRPASTSMCAYTHTHTLIHNCKIPFLNDHITKSFKTSFPTPKSTTCECSDSSKGYRRPTPCAKLQEQGWNSDADITWFRPRAEFPSLSIPNTSILLSQYVFTESLLIAPGTQDVSTSAGKKQTAQLLKVFD